MAKSHFIFSIFLSIALAVPAPCFAYLPPETPIVAALEKGDHAFVGRLISVEYVKEKKGIERAEGIFEILLPVYGAVPEKGENTKIIYFTTYEVDPCLDVEKIPEGTVALFIFQGQQNLAPETYSLSYCWPHMDLAYEIQNPQWDVELEEEFLDVSLISGWWTGKIPVKKLLSYIDRKKDD